MESFPQIIAELGPGDSLGGGMAALISGADRYYAFDAVSHADRRNDLEIFDQLVTLFRAKAPIPDLKAFPEMTLELPPYAFPSHLLCDEHLLLLSLRIASTRCGTTLRSLVRLLRRSLIALRGIVLKRPNWGPSTC